MCQVTHLGRRTSNFIGDWLPLVYSSGERESAHRSVPKIAEPWDLDRIVGDFTAAAERCKDAGLDGIELEAYGHLLDGFLSPATNHRDDEYGGSPDRRASFPSRVIRAIRRAVGPEFVVGIRMSFDEDRPGGLTETDAVAAARRYIDYGIDFISTVKGTIGSDATLARAIPSMGTPSAPFLDFTAGIKRRLDVPVMHAARIADVATARYAVREGLLDLVGMTRAQIADPHLVEKIATGREDRIRPCVGASYCLDSIYQAGAAKCIHNPATGREADLPHELTPDAGRPVRAVIIGAGPAGLEAARVLAGRGHGVTLFEAADKPGGQVRLAAHNERRRDLLGIIDWRVSEAQLAGADLRFGVLPERGDVLAEYPDVVIVATGGIPDLSFLPGAELAYDTWDVLSGAVRPRGDVLIFDDDGGYPGLDAAEVLARAGARVHFVTPERMVGPDVGGMNSPAYLAAFAEHDVTVTLARRLRSLRRGADGRLLAELASDYSSGTLTIDTDAVIVEHGTVPAADPYFDLLAGSTNLGEVDQAALLDGRPQTVHTNPDGRYQLFRIGDAVTGRNIHAAVLDALRLSITVTSEPEKARQP